MSEIGIFTSSIFSTITAGTERYVEINAGAIQVLNTHVRNPMPAMTLKTIIINVSAIGDNICGATVQKNGVDTALTVSRNAVGISSFSVDVSIADGDTINLHLANSAAVGSATMNVSVVYTVP